MGTTPDLVNAPWRKASYSGSTGGGDCVEVAAVAALTPRIAVRDSKNPAHGTLTLSPEAYAAFIDHVRMP
jgi:hypothetical protein